MVQDYCFSMVSYIKYGTFKKLSYTLPTTGFLLWLGVFVSFLVFFGFFFLFVCLFVCLFFFFAASMACGSSWTRDRTLASNQAIAVTTSDP